MITKDDARYTCELNDRYIIFPSIKNWSNEKLAKHQRLFKVETREEFPRNALGKVLKRVLREPYWP